MVLAHLITILELFHLKLLTILPEISKAVSEEAFLPCDFVYYFLV